MAAAQTIGTPGDYQRCDADGCDAAAVHGYTFDWGKSGVCCAKHAFLHQQVAQQINRSVTIHQLQAAAAAPLERDERTKLIAHGLTVEAELTESKQRGLELYRSNVSLTQQVQTLTLQRREHEAQLKDRDARILQLQGVVEERTAELAELVAEVERLRALESFVRPPEGPTVIDG